MRLAVLLVFLCACEATGPATRGRVDQVTPDPATCVEGGLAIHTGIDDDDDQQLDNDEIVATTFACKVDNELRCDGEGVLTGTVTIESPEDEELVDGTRCIEGDLIIANNEAFEILGLHELHTITGHVVIAGNPNLATLDGLDRIRVVGGSYLIQGNQALVELTPVAGLVKGDLSIIANDYLPDLAGLEGMTTAPGSILIAGNPELTSLYGLDRLAASSHPVTIRANGMLETVEHLGALATANSLTISDHPRLREIALPALTSVEHQISITHNGTLRAVELPALATAQTMTFDANASLAEIRLGVRMTNGLFVKHSPALGRLIAPQLATVQRLDVADAPALQALDLTGLQLATSVSLDNAGLIDLAGLATLASTRDLAIESCPALHSLGGLASLTTLGGNLTIADNGALTSLGLDGLTEIEGDFTVRVHTEELRAEARALAKRIQIRGRTSIE